MQCPACSATLAMTERAGVEIDYCPQCRGVWLDRGELDKIIERSESPSPTVRLAEAPRAEYRHNAQSHPKKRRESFLSDLFDF